MVEEAQAFKETASDLANCMTKKKIDQKCASIAKDQILEMMGFGMITELTSDYVTDLILGNSESTKGIFIVNTDVRNNTDNKSSFNLQCPTPTKISGFTENDSTIEPTETLDGYIRLDTISIKNLEVKDGSETVSVSVWTDKQEANAMTKILDGLQVQ